MDTMNKVFLMGRLGSDPQTHVDKKGLNYVRLSVATNRRMKSPEEKERPDWHTVFVWGQRADTCAKYLRKGSPVFVEGFLSTYSILKEDGANERKSNIRALNISFLPGGQHRSAALEGLGQVKDTDFGEAHQLPEEFIESELTH